MRHLAASASQGEKGVKIDCFCHFLPPKYLAGLKKKARLTPDFERELSNKANTDLSLRLRLMERYPEVVQVISISQPPLDKVAKPADAVELARLANDELAELVVKYPDKFIGGVACLPLNDPVSALDEAERAITQLGLKGVEIYTNIGGDSPAESSFRPLYARMQEYDLPIWLHPCLGVTGDEALFGWPYETAGAMLKLVNGGILQDFPRLKFIVHHGGSMAPFFAARIKWTYPLLYGLKVRDPVAEFRKFYCDTAVYGHTPALECSYNFFGAGHLLFGSDAPLGPRFGLTAETIRSIESSSLSAAEKELIFWGNATNLLRLAT
jgi:predicted TIM-barrel fold metal-dependent hydrolase